MTNNINHDEILENFDPDRTDYTPRELEEITDALLRKDAKETNPIGVYPQILFQEHLYHRRRREIFSDSGVLDQTLTGELSPDGQRMYFRSHPRGRKINSPEQRKRNGASYFR